ncbi:MAG TPA: hypothetical protein VNI01_03875 [Elusimicrobiota bacterium]|jgi:hypothetical protein|nr:hypothetical protein [Elusimicrobiota bacterium]
MILPSCKDVAQALSRGDFDEGSWLRRLRLRLHVFVCYVCRRYKAQIEFVNRGMRVVSEAKAPAPDFQARLIDKLTKRE